MDLKDRIYRIIKEYKTEILEYNEDWESIIVDPDWFYYADEFTLNVNQDEDDHEVMHIRAYGVDKTETDWEQTDWDWVIYREDISVEKLERI